MFGRINGDAMAKFKSSSLRAFPRESSLAVAMIVSVGWNIHFQGEVSELRTQTEKLQTKTEELTRHNDELKAENKDLKDKADQLTKNIDKLDKDNTSLKNKNKSLLAFEKQLSDFAKNSGTSYKRQSTFRSYSNAIIVRTGETVSLGIKYTGNRTMQFYVSNSNCTAEWGEWSGNMCPVKITGRKAGTAVLSLSLKGNNTTIADSAFQVLVIVV